MKTLAQCLKLNKTIPGEERVDLLKAVSTKVKGGMAQREAELEAVRDALFGLEEEQTRLADLIEKETGERPEVEEAPSELNYALWEVGGRQGPEPETKLATKKRNELKVRTRQHLHALDIETDDFVAPPVVQDRQPAKKVSNILYAQGLEEKVLHGEDFHVRLELCPMGSWWTSRPGT
jgi:hypothetical protein